MGGVPYYIHYLPLILLHSKFTYGTLNDMITRYSVHILSVYACSITRSTKLQLHLAAIWWCCTSSYVAYLLIDQPCAQPGHEDNQIKLFTTGGSSMGAQGARAPPPFGEPHIQTIQLQEQLCSQTNETGRTQVG